MALVIKASGLFTAKGLRVNPDSVVYSESTLFGTRKKFAFAQIDRVLMSSQFVLSFQVGQEVFSIQTNPGKGRHQDVIAALLSSVRAAHGLLAGPSA